MQLRTLGRSGIVVGPVGLGTEHLYNVPQESITAVLDKALQGAPLYVDMVFGGMSGYRALWAAAMRGHRDQVVLAGHLGSIEKDGQYCRSRDVALCEASIHDVLRSFETDHVDVLMIHNVNGPKEYDAVIRPGGVADLARRLKQEGKARAIGMSGHVAQTFLRAVNDGLLDVIMFPVNMSGNAVADRRELLTACARHDVGVVAMKVLGGGRLLVGNRTHYFPAYQTGGKSYKKRAPRSLTPVQCISYALAQTAVRTALVGVSSVAEMEAALAFLHATGEDRDFSRSIVEFEEFLAGQCVYCNHCLPCPVHIDIGLVARLVDTAADPPPAHLKAEYRALPAPASACTRCGACAVRCPFGVDPLIKIEQAVLLYEGS